MNGEALRGPQALEDLAAASWLGETLFAALELGVFAALGEDSLTLGELARRCGADEAALLRLAQALSALGLLSLHEGSVACTTLARRHLLPGRPGYLGHSLAYRRRLARTWTSLADAVRAGGSPLTPPERESDDDYRERVRSYLLAMDDVARHKSALIADRLDLATIGSTCVLDLGGGGGGIAAGVLLRNPGWRGLVIDIPEVVAEARRVWAEWLVAGDESAGRLLLRPGGRARLEFAECDLLRQNLPAAPAEFAGWGLIIVSNIVHAYAAPESGAILARAAASLAPDGLLLVHDFWTDGPGRGPVKAALFDLHMLIHTHQGRTYPWGWARDRLADQGLCVAGPVPLGEQGAAEDTSLIVGARSSGALAAVLLNELQRLDGVARELGFLCTAPIDPAGMPTAAWVGEKCRHGCERYGRGGRCPPRAPSPEQTRATFSEYRLALIVRGEPPTRTFHERLLALERAAFLAGHPKALAFVAGPCSLCDECRPDACRLPERARPSLEAAGVDVYAAAASVGWRLEPVPDRESPAAYLGLLLVE